MTKSTHPIPRTLLLTVLFTAGIPVSLISAAFIFFSLTSSDQSTLQVVTSTTIATFILIHFTVTVIASLRPSVFTPITEMVLLWSGVVLCVLGGAWCTWAIHLGLTTGDWEYYGIIGAMLTVALGGVTVFLVYERLRLTV